MRPHDRDAARLEDMLLAARESRSVLIDQDFDSFSNNRLLQLAVERCLEIIGEAARRVSTETRRKAQTIPWESIIGLRNLLAHEYGNINHEMLFDTVTDDIPLLIIELQTLLSPSVDQ